MPARTVTLPDHVGWRFAGNMNASAMALGDADNDGGAELVVANIRGCLAVFKYLTGNGDMGPGTAGGGRDDDRPSRRSSGSRYSPVTRGEPGSDNDEGLYGNAGLDNDSTDDESDDSDSDSDADSVLDDWTSPLHGSTGAGYNMGDPWLTIDGLGTVTSLAVGDILGTGRNSIVAVSAEGTLHVLDIVAGHPLPADLGTPNRGTAGRDTAALVVLIRTSAPLNVCRMLIADVDGDGRNELILARTDRQVYIFSLSVSFGLQLSPASIHIPPLPGASGAPSTPFTSRPGSIAHGGGSALPGGGGGPAHSLYQEALRSPANTTAGSMHLAMSSAAPSVSSLSVGQQAAPTPPATATGVGAASAASGLQASSGLAAKLGTLQRRRTVTSPPSNLAAVIASGPSGTGGDHHGLASHVGSIAASAAATATSNSTTGAATTADAPGHASVSASTPDLSPTSTPMPPQILPAHSLDLRARHGFPGQVASLALIERSEGARFLLVSQPCGTYVSLSNDGQQSTVTVLPQRAGLDLPGPKENALGMNSYLRNLNAAMSFQPVRYSTSEPDATAATTSASQFTGEVGTEIVVIPPRLPDHSRTRTRPSKGPPLTEGSTICVVTADGTLTFQYASGEARSTDLQVNHQLLTATHLEGNVVACGVDGSTYVVSPSLCAVQVIGTTGRTAAFAAGHLALRPGAKPRPCFVYAGFDDTIRVVPALGLLLKSVSLTTAGDLQLSASVPASELAQLLYSTSPSS